MIQIEQVRIQNKIIQKNFNQTSKNFYQSATYLLVKKNNAVFAFVQNGELGTKLINLLNLSQKDVRQLLRKTIQKKIWKFIQTLQYKTDYVSQLKKQ
ncbi:unnamed protein product [Paramecium primaurelia]|uniref:Uncharacterized protein n=1 Tax=Paramecium primaurelia TaxID=5886 RepID=A0A8S1P6M4_PARPR|nr:unnamed protein product [Paramecium primaurelia]